MTKIAIQGIKGCFHEMAATKYFDTSIEPISCNSFKLLCEKLKSKEVDCAIMAIENTLAGSLLPNYSLLRDYGFKIIGEEYLHINMCLMALPGTKIENIKVVQSHPVAIEQCKKYLWNLPNLTIKEHEDTAAAAKEIRDNQLEGYAAIGNALSASIYDLDILASDIQSNAQNFTRFLILSNEHVTKGNENKASIGFQLKHEAGSLAKLLTHFAQNNINLSKLQSIPVIGKPYEYMFYADLEFDQPATLDKALNRIEDICLTFTPYGSYVKGVLPTNKS